MGTWLRAAVSAVIGLVMFGALLFVPAGTFDYWQAWVFLATFAVCTWIPSIYLLRTNPAALERRMHAGPRVESRMLQKIVIVCAFATMAAMIVLSALDHRFAWSTVPTAVSLLGDVLVAAGLGLAMLVLIQNSYAAATIQVEDHQSVVTTGVYAWVRHPMYVGNIVLMVGIPLALGSYWGLVFVPPGMLVLAVRILDEEKLLEQQLAGYRDYVQKVRYRLVPYVW